MYSKIRYLNIMFFSFGLKKPFPNKSGIPVPLTIWSKLWSIVVILILFVSYFIQCQFKDFLKFNLKYVCDINELIVNALILCESVLFQNKYILLYESILFIQEKYQIDKEKSESFCYKLSLKLMLIIFIFISVIITEIAISRPPYTILINIPIFLSFMHAVLHLCIILYLLRDLNKCMPTTVVTKPAVSISRIEVMNRQKKIEVFDIKFLSQYYEGISNSFNLLESSHGFQLVLATWMIFLTSVIQVTLLALNEVFVQWVVYVRCAIPFLWLICIAFLDDLIRQQVEKLEIMIMKQLIDFKCDISRRNSLYIFKQLVETERLSFSTLGFFQMNYSLVLGVVVSVITYSIILIQMIK